MTITGSGYKMIRDIAQREVERHHLLEYGRVESVDIHEGEDDGVYYTCSILLVGRFTDTGDPLKLENVQIATSWMGAIDVPYVDDLVLVAYINGEFELPVIIGRLYSQEKKPPLYEDGQHLLEISKEPSGLSETPTFDIKFVDGEQTTINLKESEVVITTGQLTVTMTAGEKIELDAADTKVTLEEGGDVNIESLANISIKADADINIEASGNVTIKGSKIDLN
jgi:hypothetical protein